jgi:hypothetical protein
MEETRITAPPPRAAMPGITMLQSQRLDRTLAFMVLS